MFASSSANRHRQVAQGLARVLVAGVWQPDELLASAEAVLGRRPRWLRPLLKRVLKRFPVEGGRPRAAVLADLLLDDERFRARCTAEPIALDLRRQRPAAMAPAPGVPAWPVPPLISQPELAAWLGLDPAGLAGLAEVPHRRLRPGAPRADHYRRRWVAKRLASARLIEWPKPRLLEIQRRILRSILDAVPPHDAAHGFRAGRSIVTNAAPHAGRAVVLKLDLHDFFPSIGRPRVAALFRAIGYPEPIALTLAGLTTVATPSAAWTDPIAPRGGPDAWRLRRLYDAPHLPQGAPTSPALANLAAYRLDLRLSALAASVGATYTRYADDLTFSGDEPLAVTLPRFPAQVGAIALEEGFRVNGRKTRVLRQGTRQVVAGVVVNDRPNIARAEFDRLKAIVHACVRHGPADQNQAGVPDFRAHLLGRIAHVAMLHPARGAALRARFDRIAWPDPS